MNIRKIFALLALIACAGTTGHVSAQDSFVERYTTNTITSTATGPEATKLSPSDIISVQVFQEPDLSIPELRLQADGSVNLFLLGKVQLSGLTPAQAEEKIRSLLAKDYIRNPHVIVQVMQYNDRKVSVYGAVNQPSLIELPPGRKLTIIEAIAQARGFSDVANKSKIALIRPGEKERTFTEDELNRMENNGDASKIIYLQPGDRIEVGERRF